MKIILLSIAILFQVSSFAASTINEQLNSKNKSLKIETQKVKDFVSKSVIKSKSTATSKKILDKISYPDGSYKTFAYNNAGLLIDYKNYLYNSKSEKLELQEQQQFEYDKNGNETLFIDSNFDSFDGFFIIKKREVSYQTNNMPIEEIEWEHNNETKTLERRVKRVYKSMSNNNIVAESYAWDSVNNNWVLSGKSEFIFNDNKEPLSSMSYNWSQKSGEFIPEGVLEFTYNEKGLLYTTMEKTRNVDTGVMEAGLTTTNTYDANSILLNEKATGNFRGEEITAYEHVYIYENGLLVSDEYISMFGGTKKEYSYTKGKLSEERCFYPEYDENKTFKGLILKYKNQFTYDNGLSDSEIIYPASLDKYYRAYPDFCDPFYFQFGALTNTICHAWNSVSELAIEKYRGIYHYSDLKSGVNERAAIKQLNEINLVVGPNPCLENLYFSTNDANPISVLVYSASGRLVHEISIKGSKMVDTSNWEKGIYMIHEQSKGSKKKVIKLIKK